MYKIYFAIGNTGLENFVKSHTKVIEHYLHTEVEFVGETVYREGIMSGISDFHPDLIIISEGLSGNSDIKDIICSIRINCPDVRIIFISGDREVGDSLLAIIAQYGVYDLIIGTQVNAKEIVKKIIVPNTLSDIVHLIPKITVDEKTKNKVFEAPDVAHNTNIKGDNIFGDSQSDDIGVVPIKNTREILNRISKTEQKEKEKELKEQRDRESEGQSEKELKEQRDRESEEQKEKELKEQRDKESEKQRDRELEEQNERKLKEQRDRELEGQKEKELKEQRDRRLKEQRNRESEERRERKLKEQREKELKEQRDRDLEEQKERELEKQRERDLEEQKERDLEEQKERVSRVEPIKVIKPIQPIAEERPQSTQQTYDTPKRPDRNVSRVNVKPEKEKSSGLFGGLFGSTKSSKNVRVGQQVITFIGGHSGVGNSQIAFNTALSLATKGHSVMYMDLNDRFSAIDCIFQLGYSDVGVDTAIHGIVNEDYNLIDRSIVNISKILPNISVDNYLYNTYTKIPNAIDILLFSQDYMTREEDDEYEIDKSKIKDLIMYLMMKKGYDFIIIDVPCNIYDKITTTSLIYTSKIFFTVTQDIAVLTNHINNIKILNKKRINFKEKFYYLLNKYENVGFKIKDVYELLSESIRIDNFDMISIPNVSKDLIVANYLGEPILWNTKTKEFIKSISDIEKLILK